MLGHYSQDRAFQDVIRRGLDVHKGCASLIKKKPYEEVTKEERDEGKTTNFALVYQLGNIEFSISLGHQIDKEKAKEATRFLYAKFPAYKMPPYSQEVTLAMALAQVNGAKPQLRSAIEYFYSAEVSDAIRHAIEVKKEYFGQFPDIKAFLDDVKRTAKTRGWVRNFYGRKYYFADPERENYKAPNYLIQGGCSSICKDRGVAGEDFLNARRNSELTYSFLPIHDEFCFQFHMSDLGLVLPLNAVLSDLPFRVPITAGMDWGRNLHERIDINSQEDVDKIKAA